jgi:hypothetical protein
MGVDKQPHLLKNYFWHGFLVGTDDIPWINMQYVVDAHSHSLKTRQIKKQNGF